MDYSIAILVCSLFVWTAAVAGAVWYVRGRIEEADRKLLEAKISSLELDNQNLLDQQERAREGELESLDQGKRNMDAADAALAGDPHGSFELLYSDRDRADPSEDPPDETG